MKLNLDKVDRDILRILQQDGRISNASLARQVGLSPPSVLQRVRRLEDAGFIDHVRAILNRPALGYSLLVVAQISLSLHHKQPIESFCEQVEAIPEVLEVLHVSGDHDFLLKIAVRDMAHYELLIREKLSSIEGVGKIHSCFVLNERKCTTEVHIP